MGFNLNSLNLKGTFNNVMGSAKTKMSNIKMSNIDLGLTKDFGGISGSDLGISDSSLNCMISDAGSEAMPDLNSMLNEQFNKIDLNVDPKSFFKKLL